VSLDNIPRESGIFFDGAASEAVLSPDEEAFVQLMSGFPDRAGECFGKKSSGG
jgi:hypothetical protein